MVFLSLSREIVNVIRQKLNLGLPEEVREKCILHIADTIGISLAAYKGAPVALKSISGISLGASGGSGKLIGSKNQLPPSFAAFSNTALAHSLDYDDIHDLARIHPTPVILAAAIAAGDITESRATDLVTAVALGNELVCRLGYAIKPKGIGADSKWFLSQLFGYVGAAVTAGLVLGLDDTKLVHAIGLAYMQVAGGKEAGVGVGSQARSIYPAFASMGGVQAALLAREGVSAPESSMDGKTGLFQVYFDKSLSKNERAILLNGESWAFLDTSIKLFPCCRYSHSYIKSALLHREEVRTDQIDSIIVGVNATAKMLCEPIGDRCQPKTLQDAKFSIPFLVAFALVHGSVTLNNLTEESLFDLKVLELANRIKITQTQLDSFGLPIGDIQIKTKKGTKSYKERLSTKITIDEVKRKFIDCCKYVNISKPEKLWEMIISDLDYDIVTKLPIVRL